MENPMMKSPAAQIGQKLVDLCREGKYEEAVNSLYSSKIVSVEPMSMGDRPAKMEGIEAIRGKGKWWVENHQVHSGEVFGPFVHGNRFIVRFKFDITALNGPMKGKRMLLDETGVYAVEGGKVVHEEFFYGMGDMECPASTAKK
jgi:hypothetical protein